MWRILVSSATADGREIISCHTSKWCWAASGKKTEAASAWRLARFRLSACRMCWRPLTNRYSNERNADENFQAWVTRLGKKEIKTMLEPFTKVPDHDVDPSFYTDWGDTREYSLGDIGVGECAGEVVSLFSMEIARGRVQSLFDGDWWRYDEGNYIKADQACLPRDAVGGLCAGADALPCPARTSRI